MLYEKIRACPNYKPDMIQWSRAYVAHTRDDKRADHAYTVTFADASNDASNDSSNTRKQYTSQPTAAILACDGIHSPLSTQLSGTKPQPLPIILIIGLSTFKTPLTKQRGFYTVDGKHRLFLMPYGETETMWQLSVRVDADDDGEGRGDEGRGDEGHGDEGHGDEGHGDEGHGDSEALRCIRSRDPSRMKDFCLKTVRGDHGTVRSIISETDDGTIWGTVLHDRVPTAMMSKKNKRDMIICLGDACHAMTPFKGQGANSSLLDAIVVAKKIASSKPSNLHSALLGAEREIIARTAVKVLDSREAARALHCEEVFCLKEDAFTGVKPDKIHMLLDVLKERGINAETVDLDDAVRDVIVELGIAADSCVGNGKGKGASCVSENDRINMIDCVKNGNMPGVRALSFKNPNTLGVTDDRQRTLIHIACDGVDGGVKPINEFMIRWLVDEMKLDVECVDDTKRSGKDCLESCGIVF
jgi:2-polyprenyl-6-methoxyphenol hydroxylase-like FAD-dependent oxidoreductase